MNATGRFLVLRWGIAWLLAVSSYLAQLDAAIAQTVNANAGPQQSFVVRRVRVFDGERVLPRVDVLVRGGLIVAVGRNLAVPAETQVVDGRRRTLLPGFIDAHTHAYYAGALRDALRFGVTTELDMFGACPAAARRQREQFTAVLQADMWCAGTGATVPGGHGTQFGFEVPTLTRPDQARAFVAARRAEGSDYLKIILADFAPFGREVPALDAATASALIDAAHAVPMLAVAHVDTQRDGKLAIEAGIDALVHIFVDRAASPEVVALARGRGVFVIPTLSLIAGYAGTDAAAALAGDAQLESWLSQRQTDDLGSRSFALPDFLSNALESVRRLHAAGVPILAGTDAGNARTAHGASVHGELALLVRAGLSPLQALNAATALPARCFGLADRGRIAPGMRADLLLVEGDPTHDIRATRAIVSIWKNGAAVERTVY